MTYTPESLHNSIREKIRKILEDKYYAIIDWNVVLDPIMSEITSLEEEKERTAVISNYRRLQVIRTYLIHGDTGEVEQALTKWINELEPEYSKEKTNV